MSAKGETVGYTAAEVAKHCGVTIRTFKRWREKNHVPLPALRHPVTAHPLWTAEQAQQILDYRLKTVRRSNWRSKR